MHISIPRPSSWIIISGLFIPHIVHSEAETVSEKTYTYIKILDKSVFDNATSSLDNINYVGTKLTPPVSLENVATTACGYGGVLLWLSHGNTDGSSGYIAVEKWSSASEAINRAQDLMSANTFYTNGDLSARYIQEASSYWAHTRSLNW